ncbi:MAG: NAD-dependent epimerase/dehydratase family protein [Anaerolineae bacterium]|nr:NAD-dependent epimerase/dehydratase family protein [Anaerolineae bacterium]
MRKSVILITGANGEVGHGLITQLAQQDTHDILVLDLHPLAPELRPLVKRWLTGDILDQHLLQRLMSEYDISMIFHLAALLSTRAEFTPEVAHRVNVEGTLNLLHLAIEGARWRGESVTFLFPSSVAVYGVPDLATKTALPPLKEHEYTQPTTMYGCNKLYCEHLGRYYAGYYRQLAAEPERFGVDFRALRFPGLISAATLPSGGTSDYAPEMLHAAAQGQPYACFVRPDTTIPFMAMPDAIDALLHLARAERGALRQQVYNVTSFSLSAAAIAERVGAAFPGAQVTFAPDLRRQAIVDSWAAALDDSAARQDWGWAPQFQAERAFADYLVPRIQARYT